MDFRAIFVSLACVKHLKLLYMRGYIYSETKTNQSRDKAGHFDNISTSLLDDEEISKQITKDIRKKTLDTQKFCLYILGKKL